MLRWLDPTTRIRFEPSVVKHFHKRPKDWKKDSRRRADLHIRTSKKNYLLDTSVGLAGATSVVDKTYSVGSVARKLAKDKVIQYTSAFTDFREHEIVGFCAEAEGALDIHSLTFLKDRITDACEYNPMLVKSAVASEVYARVSAALQRANADGVINWCNAEFGEDIHDSDYSDPVLRAIIAPPINLKECNQDLAQVYRIVDAAEAVVAAATGSQASVLE